MKSAADMQIDQLSSKQTDFLIIKYTTGMKTDQSHDIADRLTVKSAAIDER